ncbi:Putative restriction endonuclease [Actinacidiphila yanglinensis]|uniref:Putative restriction endonuclease n=1 Tax=Actinacidiphila yanglinensis TaxID=310779 RepID=A0A1H5VMN5_9ACTN|nr:Uma2 family endonuclease [Actinacidiphila yanglinensis]SEF88592.1 Putative restriction endonuclease [Actinacidiphila yanglinensis]
MVVVDAGATAEDPVTVDIEAVQLVVELVSPGNSTMDRKVKPMLYAEAAIPRFWRLEFDPAPMLAVYELQSGRYVEQVTALAGATTHLDDPFPIAIDPAGLSRAVDAVRVAPLTASEAPRACGSAADERCAVDVRPGT